MVIIGNSGADFGARGFVTAYDQATGEQRWRFYTVPGRPEDNQGDPAMERAAQTWSGKYWITGTGGTVWNGMTFDTELNQVYIGVGNGGPYDPSVHSPGNGDNLYLASVVALDADTGKIKWHFQNTPADTHDWDGVGEPILADVAMNGRQRKVLLQANRNGFFYALDRTDGKFIYGFPYVHQTWAKGLDANGRPIVVPGLDPTPEGMEVCPSLGGGKNWNHAAYSPDTGLIYVPASEGCEIFYLGEHVEPEPFRMWMGGIHERSPSYPPSGAMIAFDAATGKKVWEQKAISRMGGSTLTTAGDLVFYGDGFGYLIAYQPRDERASFTTTVRPTARGSSSFSEASTSWPPPRPIENPRAYLRWRRWPAACPWFCPVTARFPS
jgi:quinohemoprotein ethanol dehydrogenase